jgi:DNA-directed RNA polymerase I subunit RPA43
MAPIEPESDPLFHLEKISQYVSLPPASLSSPLPAICANIFSPLLLSYYPPAKGIVLAYQNVRLSDSPPASASQPLSSEERGHKRRRSVEQDNTNREDQEEGQQLLLQCVDEYSAPFLWATAEFLVWRPRRGAWISARITHQSSTHITLLYLNSFSISILRQHLPHNWKWEITSSQQHSGAYGFHETTEGYWLDGDGMPIEDTQNVRIRDWEARSGKGEGRGGVTVVKIEGSLVTEEEEKQAAKVQKEGGKVKRKKSALKATNGVINKETNGEAMEVE